MAVTASGDAYLTGTTLSQNFPTTADAFQRWYAGGQSDAFLAKFDAAGLLRYSTFLGGAGKRLRPNAGARQPGCRHRDRRHELVEFPDDGTPCSRRPEVRTMGLS